MGQQNESTAEFPFQKDSTADSSMLAVPLLYHPGYSVPFGVVLTLAPADRCGSPLQVLFSGVERTERLDDGQAAPRNVENL